MVLLPILILFALVSSSLPTAFIFEDNVSFCSYSLRKKQDKIEMSSNTMTTKSENLNIRYKLCGRFNEKDPCPAGTAACLQNYASEKKIVLGTEFILDENDDFKSINGDACSGYLNYTIIVSLKCSRDFEEDKYPKLVRSDNCTYHITQRDPTCSHPKCTMYIDGKFIDLRPLGLRLFNIHTDEKNFSINLCETNPLCEEDNVNACEIDDGRKTPISLVSRFSVFYIGEKNQLSFHGATQKGKKGKQIEVILKCNWEKSDIENDDLKYVKKQQGKKHTFELTTSFGCIKKAVPCVVNDLKNPFLVYNLSGLYKGREEMWYTSGGSKDDDSKYFLQVCGSLELAGKNTSCKSTYAQVCENKQGRDINLGSVFRHLEVVNDGLKATIENGMHCKNDLQYRTFINFTCSKEENGPKFVSQIDCDTYFSWETPHACPKYNASRCSYIHTKQYHNCSFQLGDNYYNLSKLANTTKSINAANKIFLINICGSVIDPEAPCMKDVSVAFKDLTKFNPVDKITSIGKFYGAVVKNESLVIEYNTGKFCNGADYRSEIRFECSIVEEEPVVVENQNCFYKFLWKTQYGCPYMQPKQNKTTKFVEDLTNCTYVDQDTNKSINLGHLDPTSIVLQDTNYKYIFDFCKQNYSNCTRNNNECQYLSIKKSVVKSSYHLIDLHFALPTECSMDNFNTVNFKFMCDDIKNNDHIGSVETVNCTLVVKYITNLACSLEEDHISNGYIKHMNNLTETINKCLIQSPFTNQELNISNLKINREYFKKTCPTVLFNDTFRFVKLVYVTTDMCSSLSTKSLSYEVYLKCTNDNFLPSVSEECLERDNYVQPEYCNFFKPPSHNGISGWAILGIVVGVLILILLSLGLLIKLRSRRCRLNQRRYSDFSSIYLKDAQL